MDQSDPFHLFPYRAIVDHPPVAWPNGAHVAVWVIPNIEHFHWEIGNAAPDVRNHSRRDYGNRVGVWQLMEVMEKNGVRGTVALNGEVGKYYPRIMAECARLKWELMGHGLTNSVMLSGLPKDKEAAVIAQTKGIIEGLGQTMRGWLGPGLTETWETPDLLKQEGYDYVADWVLDDQPVWLKTTTTPIVNVPYTQECNDVAMMLIQHHTASEYYDRAIDQFEQIYGDAADSARVMALVVHPYIMGVPHRLKYFRRIFETIRKNSDVAFMTGEQILDWYLSVGPKAP